MPINRRVVDADDSPEPEIVASTTPPAGGESASGVAQPPPGSSEAEHYAWHLRESTLSIFMHAAMAGTLRGIDWEAFRLYRDRLLADCGGPSDPIEAMVIEQLAIAHLSLGLLSCKATRAATPEAVGIYSGAASRLMGEFRRSALAIQAYRAASRQLGQAAAKGVLIPPQEADPSGTSPGEECLDGELIANTEARDADQSVIPYARPEAV